MAVVSPDLAIVGTAYRFHRGDIKRTVLEMLNGIDLSTISHVAVTASVPGYVMAQRRYDNQVAFMTACRHFHPGMRGLLLVGGEKFSFSTFDRAGHYLGSTANTSCAAGTGSFLDQQAGSSTWPESRS